MSESVFKAFHRTAAASGGNSDDQLKLPSIFDVLAQESLTTSLKPGLKNLLEVVIPYLTEKIENIKKKISESPAPRERSIIVFWFLKIYPKLKAVIMFACLATQILYAFSYSSIPSPLLWLAGVRLEKLENNDLLNFHSIPYHLQSGGFFVRLWRLFLSIPSWIGRALSYGLFLLQFLDYFYTSDLAEQFNSWSRIGTSFTAPTHPLNVISERDVIDLDVGKCPICYRVRQNDTALCVSGYLFCYNCIYDYIKREQKCPITGIPASSNDLIKIYHTKKTQ